MICNVKENTLNYLRKNNMIDDKNKIISVDFVFKNVELSNKARDKYGVTNKGSLFTVKNTDIPILYRNGNRENFRPGPSYAQVNEEFFQELQEKHNEYHKDKSSDDYYQLLNEPMTPVITSQEELEPTPVEAIEEPKVVEPLDKRIARFLEKIGVAVQSVSQIRDRNGNLINAAAKADMINKIIQVVDNRATIDTLPEEAGHFFVEMLGPGHPLFKQMDAKINSYKIYSQVVDQYKDQAAYRNADGSINFAKLRKEAIGKAIAEHVIKMQQLEETDSKLASFVDWFNKLWEFITSIFNTAEENPFEDAAEQLLNADVSQLNTEGELDEEYYQLADPLGGLRADQNNITLDNSIDPRTGQKRHIYFYKGEAGKGSVTSYYVDRWLKKIFRSDQRSDKQMLIDLSKAEWGDIIHDQINDIVKSWTYADGTKREVQAPINPKIKNSEVYKAINKYIEGILNQYDPTTVFMSEVKIFDQKTRIAGSIDLIAIKADGVVDIYDWKSQEIGKDQTDIKTYKESMYRIQLENYRKILELQYGFKQFGKIRAIPMRTAFTTKNGKIDSIKGIEIGAIDVTKIPDEKSYLLPVTLRNETTGDDQLDNLIEQLNAIYDKIQNSSYKKEQLYLKREELSQLRIAIRDLQLKNKVTRLIDLGLIEYKKYSEMLANNTLGGKDMLEAIRILDVFSKSSTMLYDIRDQYLNVLKDKNDEKQLRAFEETNKKFLLMTSRVSKLIKDIEVYRDNQAKALGDRNGIFNFLNPEAKVGTINGIFASLSKIPQKAFKIFSKILRVAQNRRDARFDKTAAELNDLKKRFVAWAKSKGISTDDAFAKILQIDAKGNWNGNFVSTYESEFYKQRDKALEDGNFKWLAENLEFDTTQYEKSEKKQLEFFKGFQYVIDEKENEALIAKKMKDWVDNNNPLKANGEINYKAFHKNNYFFTPVAAWHTSKWNELQKPENAILKEMYQYFQGLNLYAEDLGMIDRNVTKFIPSINANKMDQLVFGDIKGVFSTSGFFENLEVDSGTKYTPQVDPTDGSVINKIPVYFTKDMGVTKKDGTVDYTKKSRDLFKVYGVWASHMYNYEAMQSIEDSSLMLLEAEKNKKSLLTDVFNNIVTENGKVKAINNNDRNAKLLEEFVNFYIYDRVSGEVTDKKFKLPFVNKEYSLLKTAQAAVSFFSLKTLALNPISASSQFVGGTGNAAFMAQKGIFFTNRTWAKAMYETAGSKKARAALQFFNILQEGNKNTLIDDLSISATNMALKKDNFYAMQRLADKSVQYPVAVAMMMEHMYDQASNKIVNIQQFVKDKYDYNNTFYNLPESERKRTMAKIDKEVGELQDKESILVKGVLDDKGNFSIPGIDKESEVFSNFRFKIRGVSKQILGNTTRDDVNRIRTTLYGSALMQFRNWIPEMVGERMAGLQYNEELQNWTYGKFNTFFSGIFFKNIPNLLKGIVAGFGDDVVKMGKEKYEELKRDRIEKGLDFTISEGEFIDLYRGNLRSMMLELMTLTAFATAVLSIVGGGDENRKNKGMRAMLYKAMKKYYNEFSFYYNPMEFGLLTKNPIPVLGLAEDMTKFMFQLSKEGFGQLTGNEKMTKSAKPMKYFGKMVPVAKEGMLMWATYDDDFRKSWDIRIQPGY
jgi:hypothetical protein